MTTLASKTIISYNNMNKEGLWTRFKNYLAENQQFIFAGMAMMNGNSYYTYNKILSK